MKVAKAKGRLRGKQPKLNPRQEAHLVSLLETGDHSTAELADLEPRAVPQSTPMRDGHGPAPRHHHARPQPFRLAGQAESSGR